MRDERRPRRVADQIRRELGEILIRETADPLLNLVTINRVEVTPDLRWAKVYYSILNPNISEKQVAQALHKSLSFLKRELARRMALRFMPDLSLVHDESQAIQDNIDRLLKEIKEKEQGGN